MTADFGTGVNAYNYGNGSVTVIDEANTSVWGAQFGVTAFSNVVGAGNSGNVTINIGANATVTAGSLYGISAIQGNSTNAGNITITTSTGDIITSGGSGISSNNSATSAASSQISITTLGGTTVGTQSFIHSGFDMATSGNQPGGIWAGYNGGGPGVNSNVHGNVVIDNAASIIADSGVGIGMYNFGVGDLSATIRASSTISAVSAGVNAFAQGGGNVSIVNQGNIGPPAAWEITVGTGQNGEYRQRPDLDQQFRHDYRSRCATHSGDSDQQRQHAGRIFTNCGS